MQDVVDARCTITTDRAIKHCPVHPVILHSKSAYKCSRCKRIFDGTIDTVTWGYDYMPGSATYKIAKALHDEANKRREA